LSVRIADTGTMTESQQHATKTLVTDSPKTTSVQTAKERKNKKMKTLFEYILIASACPLAYVLWLATRWLAAHQIKRELSHNQHDNNQ
jgi:hypothetical protein